MPTVSNYLSIYLTGTRRWILANQTRIYIYIYTYTYMYVHTCSLISSRYFTERKPAENPEPDYGESIRVCILISLAGSWQGKKGNRLVALSPPTNRNSPLFFLPSIRRQRFRNKREVLSLEVAREFLVGCVRFEAPILPSSLPYLPP